MTYALRALASLVLSSLLWAGPITAQATTLGVEGQLFDIIEEDFRLMLMRLIASHDWTPDVAEMQDSAREYTKNLPGYLLPRAEKTVTRWKDVGVIVSEDIYLPWVDWETGSVFSPEKKLVANAGAYFNPIAKLPAAGIERLFIFDATDPEQLSMVRALLAQNIPQLSFMLVAGDLGALSEDVSRPIYYPTPTMLDKFHVRAVPTLISFGRAQHQGHMAITDIHLPASLDIIQDAWYGLGDAGSTPESSLNDVSARAPPEPSESKK